MKRKITICVLTTALLFTVPFVEAQQPGKISRIGILNPGRRGDAGIEALSEAFRQGLKDLGYIEGKNVASRATDSLRRSRTGCAKSPLSSSV